MFFPTKKIHVSVFDVPTTFTFFERGGHVSRQPKPLSLLASSLALRWHVHFLTVVYLALLQSTAPARIQSEGRD